MRPGQKARCIPGTLKRQPAFSLVENAYIMHQVGKGSRELSLASERMLRRGETDDPDGHVLNLFPWRV
jgi:hypothetical protein